jgi:gamma-glutamyl-gamma-aminobutyrate hydrolase PuuD
MKDTRNQTWPVFGICQGLEVISVILGDHDLDTLTEIVIYGQNRPTQWQIKWSDTRMFKYFTQELAQKMTNIGLSLHAHTYSVDTESLKKKHHLREFMNII